MAAVRGRCACRREGDEATTYPRGARSESPQLLANEGWLSPVVGAATGVITGATGVFVIPTVPYLQALELDKDDLVQALGLSFTVSTIALALGLASYGAFRATAVGVSLLCTGPTLLGMFAGQAVRARMDPRTFRLLFFVG